MMRAPSTRILVDHKQFRMIREVLKYRQIYFMAGSQSIYVPSRNEKYIISHNQAGVAIVKEWPDLDGVMDWRTPGEVARLELEREFPNVRKIGWPKKSVKLFDWRWPMVFYGSYIGEAVYTDLVGAYHQIYSRLWLDCAFPRGRGTLSLGGIAGRLAKWKPARNSLIGVIRSREGAGYRGSTRFRLRMDNRFLSPHLWATIQGCLNEIANRAIESGALYINTDGYIHPSQSRVKDFQRWLSDYGIQYQSITGDCVIKGWGNYSIGERQTKHYLVGREWETAPFVSLSLPDRSHPTKLIDWWKGLDYEW